MTKDALVQKMQENKAWVDGKAIKLDFADQGAIMLDGKAGQVTDLAPGDAGAADTTIRMSWDDWEKMAGGELDGMTAFMTGKLKIEGDMSNAMQLQGVLAKLRG